MPLMKTAKPTKKTGPRKLSAWKQHEILRCAERLGLGSFRVVCTRRSRLLLMQAGYSDPRPLEGYAVRVTVNELNLLVLA
jgi:hypothetical protein